MRLVGLVLPVAFLELFLYSYWLATIILIVIYVINLLTYFLSLELLTV